MALDPNLKLLINMKDVNLILGSEATGTDFACQLKSVLLSPDTNIVREETLCPDGQFADVGNPVWSLNLGYIYGKHATTAEKALADYLLAHHGEQVDFFFAPWAGGDGYTGLVTLIAGAIGGEQGSSSNQTVELPVDGQPEPWAGIVGS
ncbi:hypothetical protein [Microlunatus parietis]|uniref:Uncharacterized protein n=1 Tax=Microlunatus parietis TaxID=682979 RepID=A0A7Y9L6K0_9ACTN|nr:hypothetical protein [Microlunatus parietis]NYE68864.1 hypothetical protein [Microlunatus parietis]